MTTLVGRLTIFTLAMLALGGALMYPAELWGGAAGRFALIMAWLLSAVPGWVILTLQSLVKSPQQGVFLALGSTTGRLLFVGFGALVLLGQQVAPQEQLGVWVVVCYLGALVIETGLVLQGTNSADAAPQAFSLLFGSGGK